MLKNKFFWIGVVLVLALAGAGYYVYVTRFATAAEPVESEDLQTAVARIGDLEIVASGTGSIVPKQQIGMGFDDSGTLIELNVQEGDGVKEWRHPGSPANQRYSRDHCRQGSRGRAGSG